jgi:hypothetical protein
MTGNGVVPCPWQNSPQSGPMLLANDTQIDINTPPKIETPNLRPDSNWRQKRLNAGDSRSHTDTTAPGWVKAQGSSWRAGVCRPR